MGTLGAPTASGCFILRSEPGLLSFSISQMRKLGLQWVGGPRGQQRSSGATANSSGLRRRPRRCRGSRCQGARGKRRVNIWGCSLGSGHFSSLRFGRVARAVPGRQGRRPHGCWDPPARPRPAPSRPASARGYKAAGPPWRQPGKERAAHGAASRAAGAPLGDGDRRSRSTAASGGSAAPRAGAVTWASEHGPPAGAVLGQRGPRPAPRRTLRRARGAQPAHEAARRAGAPRGCRGRR